MARKEDRRFKMVRISWDAYQEIARRGVFGESVDDVIRRVLELPAHTKATKLKLVRH